MTSVKVTPLQESQRGSWETLYKGYAGFYKVPMSAQILQQTWSWLMNADHVLTGFIASLEGDSTPCGFAHVRAMPSPLRGVEIGFLDDLFVLPARRGNKVADALLQTLREHAKSRGWPKIRWITADDNYRARSLYDRFADKTLWNTYEMKID